MSAVQKAREVLQQDDVSVAELVQARQHVRQRRGEVLNRLAQVSANPKNQFGRTLRVGDERKRVLAQGTPEQVLEMDRESDLLDAELEQLNSLDKALGDRAQRLEPLEAAQSLPGLYQRLEQLITDEADAAQAQARASSDVDQVVDQIHRARIKAHGNEAASPPKQLMQRLLKMRGLHDLPQTRSQQQTAVRTVEQSLS